MKFSLTLGLLAFLLSASATVAAPGGHAGQSQQARPNNGPNKGPNNGPGSNHGGNPQPNSGAARPGSGPGNGVHLPNYPSKPKGRKLGLDVGKYHVDIASVLGTTHSYNFRFSALGYPRFWSSFTNYTSSDAGVNATTWSYDFILQKVIEFQDTNNPGYDNETVLSEFEFSKRRDGVFWTPIVVSNSTVENVTLFNFATGLQVNSTTYNISFSISSDLIRSSVNSTAVLQPLSLKWDLTANNYNYTGSNSSLGLVALVRSGDAVTRVVRDIVKRNETVINHNRTTDGNATHFEVGRGHGRVSFAGKGPNKGGFALISAPSPVGKNDSDAEDKETRDGAKYGVPRGPKDEAARNKNGNSTRVVVTYKGQGNEVQVTWGAEIFVADAGDKDALTSSELESALLDSGLSSSVFDTIDDGTASNETSSTNGTSPDTGSSVDTPSDAGSSPDTANSGSVLTAPQFLGLMAGLVLSLIAM